MRWDIADTDSKVGRTESGRAWVSERAAACVRSIVTGVDDGPPVSDDAKSRYMWLALEHFCDLLCEAFTRNLDAGHGPPRDERSQAKNKRKGCMHLS